MLRSRLCTVPAVPQDVPLAPVTEADVPGSFELPATTGRIDLILGPMFAGKTSELLRRIQVHEVRCRRLCGADKTLASVAPGRALLMAQEVTAGAAP